jgi:hypothetical protein
MGFLMKEAEPASETSCVFKKLLNFKLRGEIKYTRIRIRLRHVRQKPEIDHMTSYLAVLTLRTRYIAQKKWSL